MNKDLLYKIAISLLPGIGPVNAKKLISYTGSVEDVFREQKRHLKNIPGIGKSLINKLDFSAALRKAQQELEFVLKHQIETLFYLDSNYSQRLLNCSDAPILLYYKGKPDFNASSIISIVGTRNASDYGRETCDSLIKAITKNGHKPIIVSGLAYGIDIQAHKSALQNNLQTLAILGHGFNTLYPSQHRKWAKEIIHHGALISEYPSHTTKDPKNFVKRNRIIAGISDATIVIESAKKGGSLITAQLANSYNRDVLAFPGRTSDPYSRGCNHLIKSNQAHLIEDIKDLEYVLGWTPLPINKSIPVQTQLFKEYSPEEKQILQTLKAQERLPIDLICLKSTLPMSRVSSLLLKMEFDGIIRSYPGKIYALKV